MRPFALVMLCLCLATPVGAGPWMREKGTAFLSFGQETGQETETWTSLYAEYGLSARSTLIVDLGRGDRSEDYWIGWQTPVFPDTWSQKLTMTGWVGSRKLDGESVSMYGLGANWGMSVQDPLWHRPGWLSAELRHLQAPQSVRYDPAAEGIDPMTLPDPSHLPSKSFTKLDLTAGLHLREDLMVFTQLQLYKPDNDGLSRSLTASVVKEFAWAQLQLGVSAPLEAERQPRVKLGLWFEF
ncbi:hypothetical protein [Thioclava sp. GXIMD4216]|uniref:hypothetical protein n=1 Tax=Thioclava sp. GXIMD4216 TaxID=3131929 RepID=UPI0030CAB557